MIKKITFATTGIFAMLVLSGTAPALAAKYKLQVDGLACPFCAYGIEKQFKKTSSVKKISFNINAGVITVITKKNSSMSRAQASKIIKKAGFTLRDFKKVK